MANPVVWFEMMGSDGAKLRAFYGDLFGWKYDVHEEMKYGMVEADKGRGIPGGVGQVFAKDGKPYVSVYVSTGSIDRSLAQAEKLGGRTIQPRTALPGGTILGMFTDPEGNLVGLVEEQDA